MESFNYIYFNTSCLHFFPCYVCGRVWDCFLHYVTEITIFTIINYHNNYYEIKFELCWSSSSIKLFKCNILDIIFTSTPSFFFYSLRDIDHCNFFLDSRRWYPPPFPSHQNLSKSYNRLESEVFTSERRGNLQVTALERRPGGKLQLRNLNEVDLFNRMKMKLLCYQKKMGWQ